MTVAALPATTLYFANGVTTTFAAPFRFKTASDLAVELLSGGGVVPLTLGADFTVTGGATDAGGSVTLRVAPSAPVRVRIRRRTARAQAMDYTSGDRFPAESHEAALDRAMLIDQEQDADLADVSARAILLPEGEVAGAIGGATGRANTVLGFGALGALIATGYAALAALIAPYLPPSLRGSPGGNVMATGAFTAIGGMTIAGTDMIRTSAWGTLAPLGAAFYVRDGAAAWSAAGMAYRAARIAEGVAAATVDAALAASEGRWRRQDAGGAWWTLYAGQDVDDTMFGAVHDATLGVAATAWNVRRGGTDDRAAIQAMIDWGVYFGGRPKGSIAAGRVRVGDTIHIGYGDRYISYALGGTTPAYTDLALGSVVMRNFCGRPLINVQGARQVSIDGFATMGVHFEYFRDGKFAAYQQVPIADDTRADLWRDPAVEAALGRDPDHRYAPDAAITVDAYADARPATSYPDVDYPAWLPIAARVQWGKTKSSVVRIAPVGVAFSGELNAVVLHPSGSDGNGDFVTIGHAGIIYSKRLLSVAHTQSRSVKIDYADAGQIYEFLTTAAHGLRMGQIDAEQGHLSVSGAIQIFSLASTAFAGPVTFKHLYGEAVWRIGSLVIGGASEATIGLDDVIVNFGLQRDAWRGVPPHVVGVSGSGAVANAPLSIRRGVLTGHAGALVFRCPVKIADGTLIDPRTTGVDGPATVAEDRCAFHNGTAGGVVTPAMRFNAARDDGIEARFPVREIGGGAIVGVASIGPGHKMSGRPYCVPFLAASAAPTFDDTREELINPQGVYPFDKSVSISGSAVAFDADGIAWWFVNPQPAWYVETRGGAAGDLIVDEATGTAWRVRSYDRATGATVAMAESNKRKTGAAWAFIAAFDPVTGNASAVNLRRYTPSAPAFATFAGGSADATAVGPGDGALLASNDIAVGDHAVVDQRRDGWIGEAATAVTAFSGSGRTLSLSGVATAGRRRLAWFARIVANGSA